jgi:threonine aldolase
MNGQAFDFEEMKQIAGFAKDKNIRLHLDGARLFIASAYTGVEPADYASLFDTVYISLYKYFGAATGAVLAGPKSVIDRVAHGRKLFGSGLLHAWPYTAVALHLLDGFLERYRRAVASARSVFDALEKREGFRVETFPAGTNICRLHVPATDGDRYRKNLQELGILVRPPQKGALLLTVNESINQLPPQEIANRFVTALPAK